MCVRSHLPRWLRPTRCSASHKKKSPCRSDNGLLFQRQPSHPVETSRQYAACSKQHDLRALVASAASVRETFGCVLPTAFCRLALPRVCGFPSASCAASLTRFERTTPPYGECGFHAFSIVPFDCSNSQCNYAIRCQFGQDHFFFLGFQ